MTEKQKAFETVSDLLDMSISRRQNDPEHREKEEAVQKEYQALETFILDTGDDMNAGEVFFYVYDRIRELEYILKGKHLKNRDLYQARKDALEEFVSGYVRL